MKQKKFEVSIAGRDELHLLLELEGNRILRSQLHCVGCLNLLELVSAWRSRFKGLLSEVPVPNGSGHAEMLLRELVLKAQQRWSFPYTETELCHCRNVSTFCVDQTILGGASNAQQVADLTSAGTGCGTCRPQTEKIILFRKS